MTVRFFHSDLAHDQRQCNPKAMEQRPLRIDVYAACDVIASDGVMKGEQISFADELVMDDVFQVKAGRRHGLDPRRRPPACEMHRPSNFARNRKLCPGGD